MNLIIKLMGLHVNITIFCTTPGDIFHPFVMFRLHRSRCTFCKTHWQKISERHEQNNIVKSPSQRALGPSVIYRGQNMWRYKCILVLNWLNNPGSGSCRAAALLIFLYSVCAANPGSNSGDPWTSHNPDGHCHRRRTCCADSPNFLISRGLYLHNRCRMIMSYPHVDMVLITSRTFARHYTLCCQYVRVLVSTIQHSHSSERVRHPCLICTLAIS